MRSHIKKMLGQVAVYWGNPTDDGFGQYTYDSPVEINCRWEQKLELVRDNEGNEIGANTVIYSNEDLDENGVFYLGRLSDLTQNEKNDPHQLKYARKIIRKLGTVELRAKNFILYKYYL